MIISADTIWLQPIAAPVAPPPRQPTIAAAGEREGASNERRKDSREGRARTDVSFRAFLNAATFAGLAQSLGNNATTTTRTESSDTPRTRAVKLPEREEAPVISGEESEQLFRRATATQLDTARASEYLAATTRYAKSYFSVSGTYARPGESLELTA